jgi:hypothetical protein
VPQARAWYLPWGVSSARAGDVAGRGQPAAADATHLQAVVGLHVAVGGADHHRAVVAPPYGLHLDPGADVDPTVAQRRGHQLAGLGLGAGEQPVRALQQRDGRTQRRPRRRHLDADHAAAEHDQAAGGGLPAGGVPAGAADAEDDDVVLGLMQRVGAVVGGVSAR